MTKPSPLPYELADDALNALGPIEVTKRVNLFPRLVEALELCQEKLSFYDGEYKGGLHIKVLNDKVEALLKEARGGSK